MKLNNKFICKQRDHKQVNGGGLIGFYWLMQLEKFKFQILDAECG